MEIATLDNILVIKPSTLRGQLGGRPIVMRSGIWTRRHVHYEGVSPADRTRLQAELNRTVPASRVEDTPMAAEAGIVCMVLRNPTTDTTLTLFAHEVVALAEEDVLDLL